MYWHWYWKILCGKIPDLICFAPKHHRVKWDTIKKLKVGKGRRDLVFKVHGLVKEETELKICKGGVIQSVLEVKVWFILMWFCLYYLTSMIVALFPCRFRKYDSWFRWQLEHFQPFKHLKTLLVESSVRMMNSCVSSLIKSQRYNSGCIKHEERINCGSPWSVLDVYKKNTSS